MGSIRTYLLSVTAAAILCSCIRSFFQNKGFQGLVTKFITGLFIIVTIFSPLSEFHMDNWSSYIDSLSIEGNEVVEEGKLQSDIAVQTIITERCEEYILDEAESLGAQIYVEVTLDSTDLLTPDSIKITGSVSPYARKVLTDKISEDLNIPKERQIWD